MGKAHTIINRKNLLILFFIILGFFGFHPGSRFLSNELVWPGSGGGLLFTPNSMLYAKKLFTQEKAGDGEMRIAMEIRSGMGRMRRFGIILQVYNTETREELTVGQWGSNLMVLNNGDYSNRRRLPKIYADMDTSDSELIVISSSREGTVVTQNGKPIGRSGNLVLALPEPREKDILILGNGINGTTPWSGELISLSCDSGSGFDFREGGYEAYPVLVRPKRVKDLDPGVLRFPSFRSISRDSMFADVFFNFIGFVPLGFLLLFNGHRAGRTPRGILLALGISFLFSLSIEISQIWIPGRDSSMLDLILNTAGGLAGAVLAYFRYGVPSSGRDVRNTPSRL